jgi:hypothetical protein
VPPEDESKCIRLLYGTNELGSCKSEGGRNEQEEDDVYWCFSSRMERTNSVRVKAKEGGTSRRRMMSIGVFHRGGSRVPVRDNQRSMATSVTPSATEKGTITNRVAKSSSVRDAPCQLPTTNDSFEPSQRENMRRVRQTTGCQRPLSLRSLLQYDIERETESERMNTRYSREYIYV